jgi:hypothetical protein
MIDPRPAFGEFPQVRIFRDSQHVGRWPLSATTKCRVGLSGTPFPTRAQEPKLRQQLYSAIAHRSEIDISSERGVNSELGISIGLATKLFVCYHAVTALTERFC